MLKAGWTVHTLQANQVILCDLQVQKKPVWLDKTRAIYIFMCHIADDSNNTNNNKNKNIT